MQIFADFIILCFARKIKVVDAFKAKSVAFLENLRDENNFLLFCCDSSRQLQERRGGRYTLTEYWP